MKRVMQNFIAKKGSISVEADACTPPAVPRFRNSAV